jgi:Zn-dependent protease
MPREEITPLTVQKPSTYEYKVSYSSSKVRNGIHFSAKEIGHLALAALLVVGVGLSIAGSDRLFGGDYIMMVTFISIFAASFFIHEIAHKAMAQRKGLWAEFRLTLIGVVVTLISVFSQFFKVISPGVVMISGYADARTIGKVSIVGPLTNIALSATFLSAALLVPLDSSATFVLTVGAVFNASISVLNLIPFGIFDGFKVFVWDKKIWALAFTASLILAISSAQVLWL